MRHAGVLLLGALAFLGLFASAHATRPTLSLDLDGDSRATLRDFYAVERLDGLSWVWTRPRAELSLPNLDRGVAWQWSSRVLLHRPSDIAPTVLRITIDDVVAFEQIVVHDSEVEFVVPEALGLTGVVLTFDTTPAFVPGAGDPRELGVALSSVSLGAERGTAPKTEALFFGLLAMGAIGAAFIVQRLRPDAILAGLLAATIGHAWLLMRDVTVHGLYPSTAVIIAAGTWLGIAVFARVVDSLPAALSKILPDAMIRALRRLWLVPAQFYTRVLDSIPESLPSPAQRLLTSAAYVLPVLLVINATGFWGRGVIDEEAMFFVLNYLADRPLIATIFDPLLNDWGAYQARELSYVFDLIDARVFASLLDQSVLLFVPLTRMPRGPTVDRTPADLLRHVGRDVLDAHVGNEARHIVALVRPDRAARGGAGLQQQHRRVAFGGPRRVVAQTLATSPCRLSSSTWPRYASLASLPLPFRCNIASGSVVD